MQTRWVIHWVRRLMRIGMGLGREISDLQEWPGDARAAELRQAWALLSRALRWARALQARLLAGPPAGKPAVDRAERRFDQPIRQGGPNDRDADTRRPRRDHCIDGQTDIQVVMQICADLHQAATLMGNPEAVRDILDIAEAASAMLAPAPATATRGGGFAHGTPGVAETPAAAMGGGVPDTG